jgi:hypothetical protein
MDAFFFDPLEHDAPLILTIKVNPEARKRNNGATSTQSGLPEDEIQILGEEVGSRDAETLEGVAVAALPAA